MYIRNRKRGQRRTKVVAHRVLIYRDALLIGKIKGRHRKGGLYLHSFDKGVKCRAYGLPDGSIQIKGLYGRMWRSFPDSGSRSAAK